MVQKSHPQPRLIFKTHSEIILQSMHSLPTGIFTSGFPTTILYALTILPMPVTLPVSFLWPDCIRSLMAHLGF
jgi:hypothetical protein